MPSTRKALAEPSLAAFAEPEPPPLADPSPAGGTGTLGSALPPRSLPRIKRVPAARPETPPDLAEPLLDAPAASPPEPESAAAEPLPGFVVGGSGPFGPPPIPALETGEAPAWASESLVEAPALPTADSAPAPPTPAAPIPPDPPPAAVPPPAPAPGSPDATDDDGEDIEYGTGGYFRLPEQEAPAPAPPAAPATQRPPWESE